MNPLERIIRFYPAKDHRPVEMFFCLRGDRGAVTFSVCTVCEEEGLVTYGKVIATHTAHYRDQIATEPTEDCEWLGCTCYTGYRYLAAKSLFDKFVLEGVCAVWAALEEEYNTLPPTMGSKPD